MNALVARMATHHGKSKRTEEDETKMQLKGKKVIVIGERDGIQGPAIEACLRSAGAEPVLVQTQCFV
jgi:betaine reductase